MSSEALQYMLQYDWPGNIRELSHAIRSAFNIIDFGYEKLEKHHLPSRIFTVKTQQHTEIKRFLPAKGKIDLPTIIEEFERNNRSHFQRLPI
ncbi:hypothetical protein KHA80_21880 [Anaerobacillus sp. HL2]|nr:hypothetical protein KHA80_21880 [Anaerobacillus sp. HL2]